MTAMPQSGNGGRRGRESRERENGYGGYRDSRSPTADLGVIFERLDTNEKAIDTLTTQVNQVATQVATLAGTAQVLANTDGVFKQQVDAQSTQIATVQGKLFEIVQQLGDIRASIKQTVTDALREAQTVERRADDRSNNDQARQQGYLVTALLMIVTALLGAILTYIITHPHG